MADTFGILGQHDIPATILTSVYTVPASTSTVLSSVVVCNRGSADIKFRIAVAKAGAADTVAQYLLYDNDLPQHDAYILTIGITLAATDVVRVYVDTATVSVNVFGTEIPTS